MQYTIAMDYRFRTKKYKTYNVKTASDLDKISSISLFQISVYFQISSFKINCGLFFNNFLVISKTVLLVLLDNGI